MVSGKKVSCSIVIRCYNEENHIGRLLTGIIEQTMDNVEIILVDSGSTDATLSIASHFPVKILTISKSEFSFGRALNMGCKAAQGDLIVIASAHTYPVYNNWLEELIKPFGDGTVGLAYGKQRGDHRSKFSEHQIFMKWFPDGAGEFYQSHPFCNNANSAIRKSVFNQVQFDEELTGLEDLDWGDKILKMGYKIAYVPQAEIVHLHEEPFSKIMNRYQREAVAMKKIFPHEHFTFYDFLKLFFSNMLSDYIFALRAREVSKNIFEIPAFRFCQFYGAYKGFKMSTTMSSSLKQHFYYPINNGDGVAAIGAIKQNNAIDYSKVKN